ncbi:hypothetical protein, partial [Thiohalospira sp.]|uniref:hypothetical protein n=1 Tax=Thiohalospira sp. TaxID=3080549 RepID=UPI0039809C60
MTFKKSLIFLATATALGLSVGCSDDDNGGGGSNSDDDDDSKASLQEDFSNTDRYNVVTDNSLKIDGSTLAVEPSSAEPDSEYDSVTNNNGDATGASAKPGDYFGAVDPSEDTAWWDGWTYKHPDVEGNLPGDGEGLGGKADFHPLKEEIEDTNIEPAGSPNCPAGEEKGTTDAFGKDFPVCALSDGDLDKDVELKNDHIYLLTETVQVGNGDSEDAHDPDNVDSYTLTVEEGTQIMGVSETDPSLVITR